MIDRAIGLSRRGESQVAMHVVDDCCSWRFLLTAQPQLPSITHHQRQCRHIAQPTVCRLLALGTTGPPDDKNHLAVSTCGHGLLPRCILRSAMSLHSPGLRESWGGTLPRYLVAPSLQPSWFGCHFGQGKRNRECPTDSPSYHPRSLLPFLPFSPSPVSADSLPSRHCAPPQSVQRSAG